jgi:hypothetical protein
VLLICVLSRVGDHATGSPRRVPARRTSQRTSPCHRQRMETHRQDRLNSKWSRTRRCRKTHRHRFK